MTLRHDVCWHGGWLYWHSFIQHAIICAMVRPSISRPVGHPWCEHVERTRAAQKLAASGAGHGTAHTQMSARSEPVRVSVYGPHANVLGTRSGIRDGAPRLVDVSSGLCLARPVGDTVTRVQVLVVYPFTALKTMKMDPTTQPSVFAQGSAHACHQVTRLQLLSPESFANTRFF